MNVAESRAALREDTMADENAKPASSAGAMQWLDDVRQIVERYRLPGIDLGALAEWQRKDVEALMEANRQANEGFRALIEKRNEILRESFAEWQAAVKDMASTDALSKQAEAAKSGFEKAVSNFRELSQIETEAWTNAWKTVQSRMQENLSNLQKLLQPK
jgi:phasin family protein